MRFHIGLSLNWKTIKKWLIPIGIGIAVYLGLNSMTVYAADTTLQLAPKSITINVNNQNLTYAPELNTGWAGYNVYTYSSNVGIDWESANLIYTYNDLSSSKLCTQSNGVATVQGKFIAGLGSLGGGVEYINETSGNVSTCSFKMEGIIGTFTCNNVHLNDSFSFVNIANPGSRLGITQALDVTCGEMSTGQAVDSIINNDNQNTQDIINSQDEIKEEQKETNEKLDDLNDNITNPNVDKDTGNSFFDNFSTEDNGGISGIITAPLTLINSLLDNQGTCTDLEFPILGKDVAIPSGCMLWDEVPSEMETIIQMLVCGTGAYFILTQLFKDINDLKDPNKQGVSTLDL